MIDNGQHGHATLSVVVPCWNEQATLAACVERLLDIRDEGLALEIIIVDDGSSDDSAVIAEALTSAHGEVRLVRHARNSGSGVWHVDKRVRELPGGRLRESTGTSRLEYAERYLTHRLEEIRKAAIYGVRPRRSFEEAAAKYLLDNTHKATIVDDGLHLKQLMPFIGALPMDRVHSDSLKPFIEARRNARVRSKSINNALGVVRRILNLAARSWRDERGLTWLEAPPLIEMLPVTDGRKPYPLDWDEQRRLIQELPKHLARMVLLIFPP